MGNSTRGNSCRIPGGILGLLPGGPRGPWPIPGLLGSLAWAVEQSACRILEAPGGNLGQQPWGILGGHNLQGIILVGEFLGANLVGFRKFLGGIICLFLANLLGCLGKFLKCLVHWPGQPSKVLVKSWKLQGATLENSLG